MKIIEPENVEGVKLSWGGSKVLMQRLREIDVGFGVLIENTEWSLKSSPSAIVHQAFRKERSDKIFQVRPLSNKKGWIVVRKK
jgi:hypothetical protein